MLKKRNFLVSNDSEYLYITFLGNSKNTGRIYYTDYSPELEKLLNSGIFNTAETNGISKGNYLRFTFDKSQKTVYFHHIVFCFYYRNLTAENYNQVITSLSYELSGGSENKVIDHLNRDVYNNCKANLSLISHSENKRKDIAMKSKPFFNYVEAFDGEYYRTQFTYIASLFSINPRIKSAYWYCDDMNSLIELRKYLYKKYGVWQARNYPTDEECKNPNYHIRQGGNRSILNYSLPQLICDDTYSDIQKHITEDLPIEQFRKWNEITIL